LTANQMVYFSGRKATSLKVQQSINDNNVINSEDIMSFPTSLIVKNDKVASELTAIKELEYSFAA